MTNAIRIGMVGLDTSHVSAFARTLHASPRALAADVPEARIVAAFPGGSSDFELSRSRVEYLTRQVRDEFGVQICETIEAVADACDLVMIESVDGRVHLEQFKKVIPFKKPVFIDKPFATSLSEAQQIIELANRAGVAVMSCSALRYCQQLEEALTGGRDGILACDAFGPMEEEPTQPGLFWYGIHSVEMIIAAMGPGVRKIVARRSAEHDVIEATWKDGRMATIHGLRQAHSRFGITLHRKEDAQYIDTKIGRPYYQGMLEAILRSLPRGEWAIPAEEMLEVIRFIEAANRSRASGSVVELPS